MTLAEYIAATPGLTQTALAAEVGRDPSFLSHIIAGNKPFPMELAITLFRKRGVKLGPICDASDADIDTLERYHAKGAA